MKQKRFSLKLFRTITMALVFCMLLVQGAFAASGRLNKKTSLYSSSSSKSKKLQTLEKDAVVEIISQTQNYYKVQTAEGKTGYVAKSYVTREKTENTSADNNASKYETSSSNDVDIDELLSLINAARADNGADPLVFDSRLLKGAKTRATETLKSFSHTRPDGRSWKTIFPELKMDPHALSENVAGGQKDAQGVFNGWNKSELHRKNMLNPKYKHVGLGKANGSGVQYDICWVALFTD